MVLEDFCRFCGTNLIGSHKINIFAIESNFQAKIMRQLPFEVSREDSLSQDCCQKCYDMFKVIVSFIDKCCNIQRILKRKKGSEEMKQLKAMNSADTDLTDHSSHAEESDKNDKGEELEHSIASSSQSASSSQEKHTSPSTKYNEDHLKKRYMAYKKTKFIRKNPFCQKTKIKKRKRIKDNLGGSGDMNQKEKTKTNFEEIKKIKAEQIKELEEQNKDMEVVNITEHEDESHEEEQSGGDDVDDVVDVESIEVDVWINGMKKSELRPFHPMFSMLKIFHIPTFGVIYSCSVCQRTFTNEMAAFTHDCDEVISPMRSSEDDHACPICMEKFPRKAKLTAHMQTHEENNSDSEHEGDTIQPPRHRVRQRFPSHSFSEDESSEDSFSESLSSDDEIPRRKHKHRKKMKVKRGQSRLKKRSNSFIVSDSEEA